MVECDCFPWPSLANKECTDVALAASHGGSWRRLQTSQFVHGGIGRQLTRPPVNPRLREFERISTHPCRDTRCPDRLALNRSRTESAAGQARQSPNRPDSAGFLAKSARRPKWIACKPNDPAVRQGRKEAPPLGLEPRTYPLTAGRSTIELWRNVSAGPSPDGSER